MITRPYTPSSAALVPFSVGDVSLEALDLTYFATDEEAAKVTPGYQYGIPAGYLSLFGLPKPKRTIEDEVRRLLQTNVKMPSTFAVNIKDKQFNRTVQYLPLESMVMLTVGLLEIDNNTRAIQLLQAAGITDLRSFIKKEATKYYR